MGRRHSDDIGDEEVTALGDSTGTGADVTPLGPLGEGVAALGPLETALGGGAGTAAAPLTGDGAAGDGATSVSASCRGWLERAGT